LDFVVGQSGFPMVLRVNCWVSFLLPKSYIPFDPKHE
jgi:hypothetical protein